MEGGRERERGREREGERVREGGRKSHRVQTERQDQDLRVFQGVFQAKFMVFQVAIIEGKPASVQFIVLANTILSL